MDIERVIRTCLDARIPVIATGPPGTGKTGWGRDLEHDGFYIIQVIASVREPTDIGGWPMRTDQGVVLEPAAWAKEAIREAEAGKRVVIMWDEMRTVTAPVQAALLKVIHENRVGDIVMPDSIAHLAFANSVEDSAGGIPLEPPMANRHAFVNWPVNAPKWCEAQILGEYRPQSLLSEDAMGRLTENRSAIAAYIHKFTEQLLQMPQDEDKRDGPWPSPRTWDYAAHLWATAGPDASWSFKEELLSSCVGLAAAGQFIVWRNAADLLDPEDVIEGKYDNGKLKLVDKDRPDRTYAILTSVIAAVNSKWTGKRYEGAWKAMAKAANDGAGDVAAALVGKLMDTAEGKNSDVNIVKYITPFSDLLDRAKGDGS